jgi:hypothetical protein
MQALEFMQRYQVRQDSWSPEYGAALQISDAVSRETIDPTPEYPAAEWHPIEPGVSLAQALAARAPIRVLDGVRRLHQTLVLSLPDGFWYGGLGTTAAGVLEIQPGQARSLKQALIASRLERYILLNGPQELFSTPLQIPGIPQGFMPVAISQENSPSAPVEALHRQMRQSEDLLLAEWQARADSGLMLVDGPLQYHRFQATGAVVGYIKTQHTRYLSPELQAMLPALRAGQRTPLFAIGSDRLSWYLHLGQTRPADHPLMGLVRLEVISDGSEAHRAQVRQLANDLQPILPRLATRRDQDPRAPQNLVPVAALENALRRQMGAEDLIQRQIGRLLEQLARPKE